ncbi:MAG: hypothetical protein HYY16_02885 [Planctomycetes bacterium]|nr:hypothetical protein [Planctomycetota bacterium]
MSHEEQVKRGDANFAKDCFRICLVCTVGGALVTAAVSLATDKFWAEAWVESGLPVALFAATAVFADRYRLALRRIKDLQDGKSS